MNIHSRYSCLFCFAAIVSYSSAEPPLTNSLVVEADKNQLPVSSTAYLGYKFSTRPSDANSFSAHIPPSDSRDPVTVFPNMEVTAGRIKLSKTEVLTDKGLMEFAKEKYTTPLYRVTFGPLSQLGTYYFNFLAVFTGWHPSEAEAMALYREDQRVNILSEVNSLIRLETIDNGKETDELRKMRYEVRQEGIQSLYWNPFRRSR